RPFKFCAVPFKFCAMTFKVCTRPFKVCAMTFKVCTRPFKVCAVPFKSCAATRKSSATIRKSCAAMRKSSARTRKPGAANVHAEVTAHAILPRGGGLLRLLPFGALDSHPLLAPILLPMWGECIHHQSRYEALPRPALLCHAAQVGAPRHGCSPIQRTHHAERRVGQAAERGPQGFEEGHGRVMGMLLGTAGRTRFGVLKKKHGREPRRIGPVQPNTRA